MRFFDKKSATTLIEILIYFVLAATLMLAFLTFSIQIGDLYGQTANYYEVEYATSFVHDRLEATLLKATGVDSGTTVTGVAAGAVGLTVTDAAASPTQFYVSGAVLYYKEGASAALALTPTETVSVDSFQVTVLQSSIGSQQIQIEGQFSAAGVDRTEMEATYPFHWTFTLRTL